MEAAVSTEAVSTGAPEGALSTSQGAEMLARLREKAPANTEARAPVAEPAVEQPEGAPADESASTDADAETPVEEAPGETDGEDDAAEQPLIAPPRSWPKTSLEAFKALPRETQLRLVEIDRDREATIQKGMRENAEREKAIEAERKAIADAKRQYEQAIPALATQLQGDLARQFGDIKTSEDAVRLSRENPARFVQWQALQGQAAAAVQEQQRVEHAKRDEAERWFETYKAENANRFVAEFPEYADPKKAVELQTQAVEYLTERGFTTKEIDDLWNGRTPVSAHDWRWQAIIAENVKAKAARKQVATARVAPQQPSVRPGVAPAKGAQRVAAVTELQQKLVRSGKVTDAVALLAARRAK